MLKRVTDSSVGGSNCEDDDNDGAENDDGDEEDGGDGSDSDRAMLAVRIMVNEVHCQSNW